MNKSRAIPWLIGALAVSLLTGRAGPLAWAGGKSQAAKELAESLLQRFGRQAVREGTEVLATKIEAAAARHGGDVFEAVRKVGPKALPLMEQAGAHGSQAARVMARHGEHGATWVVSRPRAMSLVLRHGDGAAGVLVKHTGGGWVKTDLVSFGGFCSIDVVFVVARVPRRAVEDIAGR